MRWGLHAIGRPRLAYAKEGAEMYLERIHRYRKLELHLHRADHPVSEGRRLLVASEGAYRVVLDERGQLCDTGALLHRVESWSMYSVKEVALLIGGAGGHTDEVRAKADWIWALSPLTMQHELALVVLLEQLYRVETLINNHPYHR